MYYNRLIACLDPDPELKKYLDDIIAKIASAQEEDGSLYTNRTINPEKQLMEQEKNTGPTFIIMSYTTQDICMKEQ